jgi:VCBS repeat-containing protein
VPGKAVQDVAFRYTVPVGAFSDPFGSALTLHARLADGNPLPHWLLFDAERGVFSGTPRNGDVGALHIVLEAWDAYGFSVTQDLRLDVLNVNDAPEAGVVLSDQSANRGVAFSWQLPEGAFVDIDAGDVLSYSASLADGSPLPGWLGFDAASGTFSGTPAQAGEYRIVVTATDLAGASASQAFSLRVEGSADLAPVTAPDAATVAEDRKVLAWGNVLDNDHDPEGGALRVADPGIRCGEYGVLTLLPNGAYAYVLDNFSPKVQGLGAGETVVERFEYLADDGTQRTAGELVITVEGTNDAPVLVRPLGDVQLARGKSFAWQMPAGSFADPDRSDTLSYSATLSNGKPLPSWLGFDPATQTFSGTAPNSLLGIFDVRVVASDGHGGASIASDVFRISLGSKTVLPKGNEGAGHCIGNLLSGLPWSIGHVPVGNAAAGDLLDRFLDAFKPGAQAVHSAFAALEHSVLAQWGKHPEPGAAAQAAQPSVDVQRHWAQLIEALNRLDAERGGLPGWSDAAQGADTAGLAGLLQGSASMVRSGADALSLVVGSGTQLKAFAGLREGLERLRC